METFLNLFLIAAALGGFALALFIFISKRKAKPIACPMDGHCDDVVRSEFSKFFGVPVEILGMLYYAVAVAAYSVFYVKLGFAVIPAEIFEEFYEILVAGHLLSAGLGFGASVVGAIMLGKFVKDFKMSDFEADILRTLAQIIWFSIFILILSGFGLYFSDEGISNILYKSAIAAVLVLVSAVLNLAILPKMVKKTLLFVNNGENPVSSAAAKTSLAFNFLAVFIWLCVLIFSIKI